MACTHEQSPGLSPGALSFPAPKFLSTVRRSEHAAAAEGIEAIVDAGAEDVIGEVALLRGAAARDRGIEEGLLLEVGIEIFELGRPVRGKAVLDAAANGP